MAGSLNGILSVARSGMLAQQLALQVTGNNIANASTPGYSRQRVDMVAGQSVALPQGLLGTGVQIVDITRARDALLDSTLRRDTALSEGFSTAQRELLRIEAVLAEPTEAGLATALDAFWDSWSDLSNDPTSTSARAVVRASLVLCTVIMSSLAALIIGFDDGIIALFDVPAGGDLAGYTATWMIWRDDQCDRQLFHFVQKLLHVRRRLSDLLSPDTAINETPPRQGDHPDRLWRQWHGVERGKPDWASWSHCLAMSLHRGHQGAVLWMGFNSYFKAMNFELPAAASPWHRLIDTALPAGDDLLDVPEPWSPSGVPLESRSMVLMIAAELLEVLGEPTTTH